MHVLSTHTYRLKREGKDDVVITPSRDPRRIPDDVGEDPIFGLAIKDGSIKVVEIAFPGSDAPEPDTESSKPKPRGRRKAVGEDSGLPAPSDASEPDTAGPQAPILGQTIEQ